MIFALTNSCTVSVVSRYLPFPSSLSSSETKSVLSWLVAPSLGKIRQGVGGPLGAELVDSVLVGSELVGGSELSGGLVVCSGLSGLSPSEEEPAVTVVPAATDTGAAPEPAMVKEPPPVPPTTTTPAATTIVSPLLTVVVAGGALVVADDETGALVMVGGFVVGGAEEGPRDVGAFDGRIVTGGREGRLEDGITPPVEVPFDWPVELSRLMRWAAS